MVHELKDSYGIGEEKIEWLNEVKATEIKEPYRYYVLGEQKGFPGEFFSEKYLRENSLEDIKRKFNSHKRQKDHEELTTGKLTINEIRKKNGFEPLMDEEADKKLILQKSLGETGLKIKVDTTEVRELVEKLNQAKDLISEINVTLGSIKIRIENL